MTAPQQHNHENGQAHDHGNAHDHGPAHHQDHAHDHPLGHSHAVASFGRAFAIGIALNTAFVVCEAVAGYFGNSVALLADAGHNLSDVLGLVVAWLASELVKRPPSARFTYGLRGTSILAALFNALFLLATIGALSWEAIQRLQTPEPVAGKTVIAVALIGIVVNGATAFLFASGSKTDINLRGAFLHMVADALVSAGVVVAGALILLTGWLWLDPVASLLINAVIFWGTWKLLRESFAMSIAAVPANIDPARVREVLLSQAGVTSLHDLHVWPVSTTEVALTVHLVCRGGNPGDAFLHSLAETLRERFGINHPTIQIEVDPQLACALAPDDVL